jgi:hypothetical protein
MTRHKNEISNGVRLENASWRTWWKQRNKLRTISPETLNWLKDSDVTWLYGPLHTAEPVPPLKIATLEERVGLVKASGKKPILKHRTITDMLNMPIPASPVLEAVAFNMNSKQSSSTEDSPERPYLSHTKSDTSMLRHSAPMASSSELFHPPEIVLIPPMKRHASDSDESPRPPSDSESSTSTTKRHISFNTFVEQCIAIDKPRGVGFVGDSSDEDDDDDRYSRADDFVQMRRSRLRNHTRHVPSRRDSSSEKEHMTIAPMPPTVLKTLGTFPAPSPAVVFVPPQNATFAGMGEQLMGIAPSPSQWEHEAAGGGFDYFRGADTGAGDEYDKPMGIGRPKLVRTPSYTEPAAGLKVNTSRNDLPPPQKPGSPDSASPPPGEVLDTIMGNASTPVDRTSSPPTSSVPPVRVPGRSILKNAHEVQGSPPCAGEPTTTALLKVGSSLVSGELTSRGRSSSRSSLNGDERVSKSSGRPSSTSPPVSVAGSTKSTSKSSRSKSSKQQAGQSSPNNSPLSNTPVGPSREASENGDVAEMAEAKSGPSLPNGLATPAPEPIVTDDGVYRSTNPTPVNSPVTSVKPLGSSTTGMNPEENGTLVGRAAEIVSSAKGLIGAIWKSGAAGDSHIREGGED